MRAGLTGLKRTVKSGVFSSSGLLTVRLSALMFVICPGCRLLGRRLVRSWAANSLRIAKDRQQSRTETLPARRKERFQSLRTRNPDTGATILKTWAQPDLNPIHTLLRRVIGFALWMDVPRPDQRSGVFNSHSTLHNLYAPEASQHAVVDRSEMLVYPQVLKLARDNLQLRLQAGQLLAQLVGPSPSLLVRLPKLLNERIEFRPIIHGSCAHPWNEYKSRPTLPF